MRKREGSAETVRDRSLLTDKPSMIVCKFDAAAFMRLRSFLPFFPFFLFPLRRDEKTSARPRVITIFNRYRHPVPLDLDQRSLICNLWGWFRIVRRKWIWNWQEKWFELPVMRVPMHEKFKLIARSAVAIPLIWLLERACVRDFFSECTRCPWNGG